MDQPTRAEADMAREYRFDEILSLLETALSQGDGEA
jgi:hypothetical protein